MSFGEFTPEQRAENMEKARLARVATSEYNKANEHLYKLEYMDSAHWAELGTKYKVRMPAYNEPCTTKGLRKYMKRTGVSNDTWKEHYTSMDYFICKNPDWVLYGAVGLMLEIREGM